MIGGLFSAGDAAVVAALIAGIASLAGLYVTSKTRKENSTQHAASVEALGQVATKVDVVGSKLDQHIGWHLGHDTVTTTNVVVEHTTPSTDS